MTAEGTAYARMARGLATVFALLLMMSLASAQAMTSREQSTKSLSATQIVASVPCSKVRLHAPVPWRCNRALHSGAVSGRTRSGDDQLVMAVDRDMQAVVWLAGWSLCDNQLNAQCFFAVRGQRRAPFWSVFATAPRLRN